MIEVMQACRSVQDRRGSTQICALAFRLLCHRVRCFIRRNQIGRLKAKQVLDAFCECLTLAGSPQATSATPQL